MFLMIFLIVWLSFLILLMSFMKLFLCFFGLMGTLWNPFLNLFLLGLVLAFRYLIRILIVLILRILALILCIWSLLLLRLMRCGLIFLFLEMIWILLSFNSFVLFYNKIFQRLLDILFFWIRLRQLADKGTDHMHNYLRFK